MPIPNGTTLKIAKTYEDAKKFTAISLDQTQNLLTLTMETGHSLVVGDAVHITNDWVKLSEAVHEVQSVNQNQIILAGSLDAFLEGEVKGIPEIANKGSVRKVTEWAFPPGVLDIKTSGGEQQTGKYQDLGSNKETEFDTIMTSIKHSVDMRHIPNHESYLELTRASISKRIYAVCLDVPDSEQNRYFSATVSFNQNNITMDKNDQQKITMMLNMQNENVALCPKVKK